MRGDEGIEGNSVLDEFHGGIGVVLWQALRDAVLWAHAPPERTAELFRPDRVRARAADFGRFGVDREVAGPLAALSRVLGSASPPERSEVASACRAVSQWADARGCLKTALAFAQGAAVVTPMDAAAANRVGWLARRRAEYVRAETWFRRAIGLARRSGDRQTYSLAYIGLGNLYLQRGQFADAREALLKAYRTARRASLRHAMAMSLHDLFCIAAHLGHAEEAEVCARGAFRAYGPRNLRQVMLAHDVAWFWLLQGYHARALTVFRTVSRHMTSAKECLLAYSNIARAAGGAGEQMEFLQAWTEVWGLTDKHPDLEGAPEALLNLAYGAASLGDAERVEIAATWARAKAVRREEADVRRIAERMLDLLDEVHSLVPGKPPAVEPSIAEAADALAADFVRVLSLRVAK